MPNRLSRRRFLGLAGFASATAMAAPALPLMARAASPAQPALAQSAVARDAGELATLLDLAKCQACGACVSACKDANAARFPEPKKPFPPMLPTRVKVEDWSDQRDVDDRLTPYTWLFVDQIEGEWNGKPFAINAPRRCLHCQNPPCANLCPWGSAYKQANGVVRIDPDTCLGGAKCKQVCPWSIPMRQTGVGLYLDLLPRLAGNGVMFKCDRCHDRLAAGRLPACIEACPFDVQQIGPREAMLAKAKALAAETGGFLYGDKENGGTNTFYVSPVPFEVLEKARRRKEGRPHFQAVADSFADQTVLAAAVATAPLAGVAAAGISIYRSLKRKEGDDA